MSTLCWNCRGLSDPRTVKEILALEAKNKTIFIFLMETKVRHVYMKRLRIKLNFERLVLCGWMRHWRWTSATIEGMWSG